MIVVCIVVAALFVLFAQHGCAGCCLVLAN